MDERKKAANYAGATAAGLAGILGLEAMKNPKRKPRKRRPIKKSSNASSIRLAQEEVGRLEKIKSKDLSPNNREIKQELIKRQKDIIKGLKPETLPKIAAKVGLKSIPGVGAFLSALTPKPAGKGSSLDGFKKGGAVMRGRGGKFKGTF
jgi:hypothetical protein